MNVTDMGNRGHLGFQGRFKLKEFKTSDGMRLDQGVAINGSSLLAGAASYAPALLTGPGASAAVLGGPGFSLLYTAATNIPTVSSMVMAGEFKRRPDEKPAEPAPEPPEQIIQKAIEALDVQRQKQREQKEGILKAYEAEQARLNELQAALKSVEEKAAAQQSPIMAEELEIHRLKLEVGNQERVVTQMKANAQVANAIDQQFEMKMQGIKKNYLAMMSQLQQIEQNKKMLEMQKTLEQMKGNDFQTPQLKLLQEKIEEDLNKTSALVDGFVSEADTLSLMNQEQQAALIEALRAQGTSSPPAQK